MKTLANFRKNKFPFLSGLILTIASLLSCSVEEKASKDVQTEEMEENVLQEPPAISYAPPAPEEQTELKARNSDQTKIIRKASVRFQVSDYQDAFSKIENRIKQFQGIIISTNETREDNSLQNSLNIKVPAEKLDNLLNALTKQAVFIDYKNISSEDVSLEFIDVSARMQAKKAVEQRYLELLKKAATVEDMIEIENQLLQIREDIESSQARLNYINTQVAYSTIDLEIYDNKSVTEDTNTFGIRIINALKVGWESLLDFLFGIVTLWPFLLILPVVIILIRKLFRRFRAPKP